MSRLIVVVLFSILIVGIVSVLIVTIKSSPVIVESAITTDSTVASLQYPLGTINGSSSPELIPDRVAYSILFRLIANSKTPEERNRIESYIRGMLNIGCKTCGALMENGKMVNAANANRPTEQEKADVDAVFATVDEFKQQVESLDNQAREIKVNRRSDPQALQHLIALQAQKNILVENKIASLINRLSPVSRSNLQSFINEHLKQKITIAPARPIPQN